MPHGPSYAAKVLLDRTVAAVGLVGAAPACLAIALAIRLTMGGPVLFTQLRPGLRGRPFRLYKFRTMVDALDSAELHSPAADERRLTRLGRFLRATSMDELPQLWNVLRGDMSLVGPRPLLMEYLERYTPEQARRHRVRPGITGWAQINGRNATSWEQRFAHDVWYVDHWSLGLDLKIIVLTLLRVARREGISNPGHATMPAFKGSSPEADP